MIALVAAALAEEPAAPEASAAPEDPPAWQAKWYWQPNANVNTLRGASGPVLQARATVEAGRLWREVAKPHKLVQARVLGTGLYGLNSGSFGGGLQLGVFGGVDGKWVRATIGPDLWVDGYGGPNASDLYLPVAPGASLPLTVIGKITEPVQLLAAVTPSWPFVASRWSTELVGIGQLGVTTGVLVPKWGVVLGWAWSWNAAGHYSGPVISGGLPRG